MFERLEEICFKRFILSNSFPSLKCKTVQLQKFELPIRYHNMYRVIRGLEFDFELKILNIVTLTDVMNHQKIYIGLHSDLDISFNAQNIDYLL
jgi:hypothetical protein